MSKRIYVSGTGKGSVAKALLAQLVLDGHTLVPRGSETYVEVGICLSGKILVSDASLVIEEELDELLEANYKAPRDFIEDCIERMPFGGHIIVFGSVAAKYGNVNAEDYAAMKAALAKYCELRARSVREHGIKISLLNFGAIDSAFWDGVDEKMGQGIIPDRKKALTVDEVVETVIRIMDLPKNVALKDATIASMQYQ